MKNDDFDQYSNTIDAPSERQKHGYKVFFALINNVASIKIFHQIPHAMEC